MSIGKGEARLVAGGRCPPTSQGDWFVEQTVFADVAQLVETGSIGLNGYVISTGSPFGGIKSSGIGREFGPKAMLSYQEYKSIYVMA